MILTLKQKCGRKGLTMEFKKYMVISEYGRIEYECLSQYSAIQFIKMVRKHTNTKYYIYKQIAKPTQIK